MTPHPPSRRPPALRIAELTVGDRIRDVALRIPPGATTDDLLHALGTTSARLDGHPVRPGEVLIAPVRRHNRPPRTLPAAPEPLVVPSEPVLPAVDVPFGWAATIAGVLAGVVLALLFSPVMAALGILGPFVSVATWWEARRRARRERRRASAGHDDEVGAARERLARQHALAQLRARRQAMGPAALTRRAHHPRLWERRPHHHDAWEVALGRGPRPWQPPLTTADASPVATDVRDAIAGLGPLRAVPWTATLAPGSAIGIAGPARESRRLARWIVVADALHHGPADLAVRVLDGSSGSWQWIGWLPHAQVAGDRPNCLVVADGVEPTNEAMTELGNGLTGGAPVSAVVTAPAPHQLPAWCTVVVRLDEQGRAVAIRAGGEPEPIEPYGLGAANARQLIRSLARVVDPLAGDAVELLGTGALVRLTELVPSDASRAPTPAAANALPAVIGQTVRGPIEIDLVRDGPHALVAGTTGSGKSELLRTWIASLAVRHSVDDVTFVLVDYKGGSAFHCCARLPHVAGVVTDLDHGSAARALRGLDAELRRRERLLRDVGADDLAAYRAATDPPDRPALPRLVLVIDEFASLAADLPEFLSGLVSVAQRGRSLGVHLVLATQRPAGVVNDAIRANTNLRIALRVTDAAEALDVVADPSPASFPRHRPGLAAVRRGPGDLDLFHTAIVTAPVRTGDREPVRVEELRAPVWPSTKEPPAGASEGHDERETDRPTDLEVLVERAVDRWRQAGAVRPHRPWAEPLPERWEAQDIAARPGSVLVGLVDQTDEQRLEPWRWTLGDGNLALIGSVGSGVTTAIHTIATGLAAGAGPAELHIYAVDGGSGGLAALAHLPHVAGVVDAHDRERLVHLVRRLAGVHRERAATGHAGSHTPAVLLAVDHWAGLAAACTDLDGLALLDDLARLVADGPACGIHAVVGGDRPTSLPSAVLAGCPLRIVLQLADRHDAAGLGVIDPVPADAPAGRGVLLPAGRAIQVALCNAGAIDHTSERLTVGGPPPIRSLPDVVAPLGVTACLPADPASDWRLAIGRDDATLGLAALVLRSDEPALVAGPRRSGRSTALLTIAAAADPVVTVLGAGCRPSPLGTRPDLLAWYGTDLVGLVGAVERCGAEGQPPLVLIDDAEAIDDVGRLVVAIGAASGRLVLAGRADHLRTAWGHWTRVAREGRTGLLLRADVDLDGDLLGTALPRLRTATGSRPPGRGWLVDDAEPALVHVALPPSLGNTEAAA